MLIRTMSLSLEDDNDWLTPLHCFVRKNFVEVFTYSEESVKTPAKRKQKRWNLGQVGVRCPYCRDLPKGFKVECSEKKRKKTNDAEDV